MKVDILNHTPHIDRTIVACARGDYMDGSLVGADLTDEDEYGEIVESIDYDEEEWGPALETEYENADLRATNVASTRTFIKQLLRRGHFGPFEQNSVTFSAEGVSRVAMAQLSRHRHISFDIQSQRYVDFSEKEPVIPPTFEDGEMGYRDGEYRDTVPKQKAMEYHWNKSIELYENAISEGVPKEDARFFLPQATPVNMTFTMNMRSLMHVLDLRKNAKAQWEARELATEMVEAAKEVAPITLEMYEEYTNNNSLRAP